MILLALHLAFLDHVLCMDHPAAESHAEREREGEQTSQGFGVVVKVFFFFAEDSTALCSKAVLRAMRKSMRKETKKTQRGDRRVLFSRSLLSFLL